MKPKTKEQKLVYSLHKKLSKISNRHLAWGKEELFNHIIHATKNECTCMECGHKWKEKTSLLEIFDGMTCPQCNKQRKLDKTRKRVFMADDHFKILTTFHEYQVIRFVHIFQTLRVGQPADYRYDEVVQHWISPKGKRTIIAKHSSGYNYYRNYWYWSGRMEVRSTDSDAFYPRSQTYPKQKIIPEIIRNGFLNEYHNIHPSDFFKFILSTPKAETLLKAGYIELFTYYYNQRTVIERYWPSIRICFRNNYMINDPNIYFDQLMYLENDGKDLLNARYVCPKDLDKEHTKYIKKERLRRERERKEELMRQMEADNIEYKKNKEKYFGFFVSNDTIDIKVLQSIEEFCEEGKALHHCVYSRGYYEDKDTLILSARKNDERLETIQLNLSNMKIIQSRGLLNKPTEYHDEIIKLINNNIPAIRALRRKRQKQLA